MFWVNFTFAQNETPNNSLRLTWVFLISISSSLALCCITGAREREKRGGKERRETRGIKERWGAQVCVKSSRRRQPPPRRGEGEKDRYGTFLTAAVDSPLIHRLVSLRPLRFNTLVRTLLIKTRSTPVPSSLFYAAYKNDAIASTHSEGGGEWNVTN